MRGSVAQCFDGIIQNTVRQSTDDTDLATSSGRGLGLDGCWWSVRGPIPQMRLLRLCVNCGVKSTAVRPDLVLTNQKMQYNMK